MVSFGQQQIQDIFLGISVCRSSSLTRKNGVSTRCMYFSSKSQILHKKFSSFLNLSDVRKYLCTYWLQGTRSDFNYLFVTDDVSQSQLSSYSVLVHSHSLFQCLLTVLSSPSLGQSSTWELGFYTTAGDEGIEARTKLSIGR